MGLCLQQDLLIDRFELLVGERFTSMAQWVMQDMAHASPDTDIRLQPFELEDPWDFESVWDALYAFARSYPFDPTARTTSSTSRPAATLPRSACSC